MSHKEAVSLMVPFLRQAVMSREHYCTLDTYIRIMYARTAAATISPTLVASVYVQ